MPTHLCISIRFIQPYPLFHGSRDGGEPEWPPSPMRLFQALLNAACLRMRGRPFAPEVRHAFKVLEVLRPHVVAPAATVSEIGYRAYVPHNQTDLVTAAWSRGNTDATIASHRVEKDHRPMRITTLGDDLPTIHYLYPLDNTTANPTRLLESIRPSVRAITHLGWGIDQVIADATIIDDSVAEQYTGDRYVPSARGGVPLRAPREGSLEMLHVRYDRFLNRLTGSDWTPVPPLTGFERIRYRRSSDPAPRPHAVFKLLDENDEPTRYPHAKLVHIAGMVRHLARKALQPKDHGPVRAPKGVADPEEWLKRFVCGKGPEGEESHLKISYVPLPSIGQTHADAMIRNIMLVAPVGCEDQLDFVASRIDGLRLSPEINSDECETDSAITNPPKSIQRYRPPRGKFIETCYLGTSCVWESITPAILDRHLKKVDRVDKITRKARKVWNHDELICLALKNAGIETPCRFTWQSLPFIRHGLSAHKYVRDPAAPDGKRPAGYHLPKHLKDRSLVHVRLEFENPVPGPITLGAGRHCGFGLMAAVEER